MLNVILYFIILSYILITNQVASIITFKFVPETKVADTHMSNNYWDCVDGPRVLDDNKESVAVYLDDVWVLNEEIKLPLKTEIIFGEDSMITDQDTDSITCEENRETEPSVKYWHDPYNWEVINDNVTRFLHAEMIPNEDEKALFLPDATYFVTINVPFRIGQLEIGDYIHNTYSFLTHLNTIEGSLQFKTSQAWALEDAMNPLSQFTDAIIITEQECVGCVNSNLGKIIMNEICSRVDCPEDYPCQTKIQPVGHCCSLCGSIIKFKNDQLDDQSQILFALQDYILNKYSTILMSILRIEDKTVQIVLLLKDDKSYDSSKLENALQEVVNGVKYDLKGTRKESVTFFLSDNLSTVDTVALVLTLLCLLFIIVGVSYIIVKKRRTVLNWMTSERITLRAFWQGKRDDVELAVLEEAATSSHSRRSKSSSSMLAGFRELLKRDELPTNSQPTNRTKKTDYALTYRNPIFDNE